MTTVYRVLSQDAWERARAEGSFRGEAHDLRDGFIHFSAADQLASTLRSHYAGVDGLVLLHIRVEALPEGDWRWEPSRDGALFPHLYSALPVTAVHHSEALALGPDGEHKLPALD